MVWLTRRLRHDERGAALVLMALVMTVLLGFSALVIDLGAARQMKRQSANSADASALGSAQDLPAIPAAAVRVKQLALENFGIPLSAWSSCTDSQDLAEQQNALDGSDCISYDTSFNRVRVKVPDKIHDTFFASVIGFDTVSVSAGATAGRTTSGFGGVLPFGLPGGSGGGNGHECFKTGTSGHIDSQPPCDGPDSGNFGLLDVFHYGNETLGTTPACGNGSQQFRLENNIAIGLDHYISLWPDAGFNIDDACGTPGPNRLGLRPGNIPGMLDDGLVDYAVGDTYLSDDGGSRLTRGANPKRTVAGNLLDNKGLWEFIGNDASLTDVPNSCLRSGFETALTDGDPDNKTQLRTMLETCFSAYNNSGLTPLTECAGLCTGVIFNRNTTSESPIDVYDIQLSPRFAYVPQLMETTIPNPASGWVRIASVRAMFIQRVFGGCGASCGWDFEPGIATTPIGASNQKAEALTGFVFPLTSLPGGIATSPAGIGANQFIQLFE